MRQSGLSAHETVKTMLSVFASHGLPDQIVSDNGTNFMSSEFKRICRILDIKHKMIDPHYHKPLMAERHIQSVKCLIKKAKGNDRDYNLSILDWVSMLISHNIPLPAELPQGRKFRTELPSLHGLNNRSIRDLMGNDYSTLDEIESKYWNRDIIDRMQAKRPRQISQKRCMTGKLSC